MRWVDVKEDFGDFWKEFRQVRSGIFSLIMLGLFVLTIFIEPYIIPYPEARSRWRDITYWENNPRSTPPVWVNWFSSKKYATTREIRAFDIEEKQAGKMTIQKAVFRLDYSDDVPPIDVFFRGKATGSPVIVLSMKRPDGQKITLVKKTFSNVTDEDIRISADKDARQSTYNFAMKHERQADLISQDMIKPTQLLFAQTKEGLFRHPEPLHGEYDIIAEMILPKAGDRIDEMFISLPGSVSGWLGTDNSRRDLWSGVIAGVRWALLIGIMTAVVAVSIGVVYGVISAYFGGWVDSLLQRIFEIFVSIPLLPLLIVMSAIFKPSIWTMIFMMSAFFWVGPVKTVRSMGMQIKEETYIEASKAFGASHVRIIFKHMVPLLVPYAFASMALYVPGAIVYESTISLLGLGDSTIVTWGQILHGALSGGAVLNGQWWWVIPPGLAIALMGMTFAFIGFAMDKILHPKLRTR